MPVSLANWSLAHGWPETTTALLNKTIGRLANAVCKAHLSRAKAPTGGGIEPRAFSGVFGHAQHQLHA